MSWESDAKRLHALRGIKWNRFEPDVIPAFVADMDLPQSPAVIHALQELVDHGDFGYNFAATAELPEVFAQRYESRFGWRPDVSRVRIFSDVLQVVAVALWSYAQPGDGVVMFTPVYTPFWHIVESAGCRVVDVPLEQGTWRLDPEALEAAIDPGTRIILTCNPHNPTGRAFSRKELEAIAQVAEKHDLLIISDEIWADLTYPGSTHLPIAAISEDTASRTVTVASASKAFSIAGLRCAIADLGHLKVAEVVEKLPQHLLGAVGSPGAEAMLAAWTSGDEWLTERRASLHSNRDHLATRLAVELPDVGFTPPEATYLAWLDFSRFGLGDDPADELLTRARVALSKGADFGTAGKGFARLNFATTRELLDEIVDRIVRTLS